MLVGKRRTVVKRKKVILVGLIIVPLLLGISLAFLALFREPLCESRCNAENAEWERKREERLRECYESESIWLRAQCGMEPAMTRESCDKACKLRDERYTSSLWYILWYVGAIAELTLFGYLLEDKFVKNHSGSKVGRIMFYVLTPVIAAIIVYGAAWIILVLLR